MALTRGAPGAPVSDDDQAVEEDQVQDEDQLEEGAQAEEGDQVMLFSDAGKSVRFNQSKVRLMGRNSKACAACACWKARS